ncbi:MAG: PAS domain-containing sensor histidine kinase [Chloroflexota bacterium]
MATPAHPSTALRRRLLYGYVGIISTTAAVLVARSLGASSSISLEPSLLWLSLVVACAAAEHLSFRLHPGWLTAAGTLPHLASAVLVGPGAAMLAGVIGALAYAAARRELPVKAALNAASVALAIGAASAVLARFGGLPLLLSGTWLGPVVAVAASGAYYVMSVVSVAVAVALDQQQPFWSLVLSKLGGRALPEIALGLLGVTMAIVLSTLPIWSVALILPAVLVYMGKRSSEALHRTESRLERILATAQDAIVLTQADGRIVLFNAAAEQMFGHSAAFALGRPIAMLIPEWDQATPGKTLQGIRASGEEFPLEATLSPTRSGTEELYTLIARDVTERKRAEAERAQLLAREESAHAQADAAVRARDEFLSIAAHELRTPITTLRGYAQLLSGAADGNDLDPALLVRGLSQIEDRSLKLAELVNELMDASRLETGKVVLKFQRTDLMQLVRGVVFSASSANKTSKLHVEGPDAAWVDVDTLRIEQVLTNLVGNAVKFSPNNGLIELVVRTIEPDRVELAVRDHGVGIAAERRARLFDRFYQAHGEGHLGGMGLGLYLSRQFVELHHGRLTVEFPADGGTRFIMRLPSTQPSTLAEDVAKLPEI